MAIALACLSAAHAAEPSRNLAVAATEKPDVFPMAHHRVGLSPGIPLRIKPGLRKSTIVLFHVD